MRRMEIWLLTAVLLAGCASGTVSKGGVSSGTPAGSAAQEQTGSAPTTPPVAGGDSTAGAKPNPCVPGESEPQLVISGNFVPRQMSGSGHCQFVVDSSLFRVRVTVRAKTAADALESVNITGAEWWPEQVAAGPNGQWVVQLAMDGATARTGSITLAVPAVSGAGAVLATLTPRPGPTLRVSYRTPDGNWQSVRSGSSLPSGPKQFRLKVTGGLSVKKLAADFLERDLNHKLTPDRVTVLASDELEVEFTKPPSLLQLWPGEITGMDGLRLPMGASFHMYIGDAPALVVADPITGQEERLAEAPPDLGGGVVRADGRFAALIGLHPDAVSASQISLVNLKSGAMMSLPERYPLFLAPGFDPKGRLVLHGGGPRLTLLDPENGQREVRATKATGWTTLSPDGRYLAGHAGEPPAAGTGGGVQSVQPRLLVITDLQTGEETTYPWPGQAPATPLVWLPDGRLLATAVSADAPGNGPVRYDVVNLQTGARTPYDGKVPAPQLPEWGAITVTTSGGWESPLGQGLLLGRLPDGRSLLVRWPNFPNRRYALP